jgi:hypothetical protein
MTKYILLNDLHLSDYTEETVFSILSYAASKSKESGSYVAILGDFYDTVYKSGQIDARLQQRAYNFFKSHFSPGTLYLLPGNHDMYNGFPDNALTVFSSVATVYDTPTVDKDGVLWLPYHNGGYTHSMIKQWKRDGAKTCFTHNDFKYVNTRKNHISREGMDPSIFEGVKVFNGHYHYPNEGHIVTCMGSQYAIHKSETFDQKRLYTVAFRDGAFWQSWYEKIRFGRREFVYPIDYAQDLWENYWVDYVRNKKPDDVPPPTYPTIQDSLVVELDGASVKLDFQVFCSQSIKCPVILRQAPQHVETKMQSREITLDTPIYENIKHAVKDLYDFAPDMLSTSLEDIEVSVVDEFKSFHLDYSDTLVEHKNTSLRLTNMSINNFCCVKNSIQIEYDMATTKVMGENGCGKTIQYPTALLYCISGVIDGRFSEERLVLSDVRADDTKNSSVSLNGFINDKPFVIDRVYNGKKTTLTFKVNGIELKFPTIKQKQREICRYLFNIYTPNGTCPNRFAHKIMLQRVIWKQGGRGSDLLKMSKDSLQSVLFETLNKGEYNAFITHIKKKISDQKKKMTVVKDKISFCKILCDERKEVSESEDVMLKAWMEHRRDSLHECRNELTALSSTVVDKKDIEEYIEHTVRVKVLQNRIKDLLDSKEGTRWTPEFTLNKLQNSFEEAEMHTETAHKVTENIKRYVRCLETFKHIQQILFARSCDIMKNYSEVNFLPSKLKKMTDGTLMKYMSGGEYEHQSLRLFVDFQCFLKKYIFWDCNVTVFDEPGTAMSTNALQQFVDGLERDRCNLVITHKPIKCSIEVHLP